MSNLPFSKAGWSVLQETSLDPGDVHVYASRVGGGTQPTNAVRLLSQAELERARSFVRECDRSLFVESRAFLRRILAGYVSVDPSDIQFEYGRWGKPRMSGVPASRAIEFSLSHARGIVVVGVTAHGSIGIDVEVIRRFEDHDSVARRFFTPGEYRAIRSLPEPARLGGFFRCWTKKEAVLKALGTGLFGRLDAVDVGPDATAPRVDLHMDAVPASEWSLIELQPWDGVIGAVATPFRVQRIRATVIA